MKEVKDRDHPSTKYCYDLNVSYVVKKKAGVRNVLVLSTTHKTVYTTRDERKKPQVIRFYDRTKGGVDVMDMMSGTYIFVKVFVPAMHSLLCWIQSVQIAALLCGKNGQQNMYEI